MRHDCEICNIGGVARRSPHYTERNGKCILCDGLGWVETYATDYLVDKQEIDLGTKEELERELRTLKEEKGKLEKSNKNRFETIANLEKTIKIQNFQLSLLFEHLSHDVRHKGFANVVRMLGGMKGFWDNKPMSAIEKQIKDLDEPTGLLDFLRDIDDDDDPPPFFRRTYR